MSRDVNGLRAALAAGPTMRVCRIAGTGLVLLGLAACSTAPAEPIGGPVLPGPRVDAKTQLEYGGAPPRQGRY